MQTKTTIYRSPLIDLDGPRVEPSRAGIAWDKLSNGDNAAIAIAEQFDRHYFAEDVLSALCDIDALHVPAFDQIFQMASKAAFVLSRRRALTHSLTCEEKADMLGRVNAAACEARTLAECAIIEVPELAAVLADWDAAREREASTYLRGVDAHREVAA